MKTSEDLSTELFSGGQGEKNLTNPVVARYQINIQNQD